MIEGIKKPELLIPAGSLENMKIAIAYGADAVYIGGEQFGLRANAKNFSLDIMRESIEYAHERDVKVYVTANIIAHNADLDGAKRYFEELKTVKPDALIVADPGMLMIAKETLPDMEFHLSTQANNTNYASLNFWESQGVKRVVIARELSLKEVGELRQHISVDLDIEAFVHGAMCISYSGRCLLSNYMVGRDANQGACTHPCRWKYNLVEETRPGEYMPIVENERGTYIYNSKDLCMIDHLDDLVKAGINSLKIEGRMKTGLYVATVTRAYRQALDTFFEDPSLYDAKRSEFFEEIKKCSYRHFTTGFYYGRPDSEGQVYDNNTYVRDYVFVGRVIRQEADGRTLVEQRNKFSVGDTVELLRHSEPTFEFEVKGIETEEGEVVESAPHPKQHVWLNLDCKAQPYELIRKINPKHN